MVYRLYVKIVTLILERSVPVEREEAIRQEEHFVKVGLLITLRKSE